MMAKISKGGGFGGAVRYVLDPKKSAELVDAEGLRLKDLNSIIDSFKMQQELNPKVSKPVGHISLNFSVQDKDKLTNEVMVKIAREYMDKMQIKNSQYLIGRHHDKDHYHLHIIYNRIDNNGKTISDRNDRFRSEKICKELTSKYNLYLSGGKENVKRHRLKEPDKTKYEIYDALKRDVSKSKNWKELIGKLKNDNINVEFKMRSGTNEPQGVRFVKNGYNFNGSKVDKEFSFSKIDKQLDKNNYQAVNIENNNGQYIDNNASSSIGSVFNILPTDSGADDFEEDSFRKRLQKKKKKGISR